MDITGTIENILPEILPASDVRPARPKEKSPAPKSPPATGSSSSKAEEEGIRALAEKINRFLQEMKFSLQFVPGRESGNVVIKVLDSQGNLIRRIPSDEMAALSAKMGGSAGLVVNEILD